MSDPYLVLGVGHDADDAAIRAAYLEAIKACPPERDRQRFETVRAAYDAIRDRRARLSHELFDTTEPSTLDILERAAPVGPPARPSAELFAATLRGGR
jgi:curved DNA-binding protein CbpA